MLWGAKGTTETLSIYNFLVAKHITAIQNKLFATLDKRKDCLLEDGQLTEKCKKRTESLCVVLRKAHGRACLKTLRNLCRWAYYRSRKGHGGIDGIHLFNLSSHFYNTSWRNTGSELNQSQSGKSTPELSGWKYFWGVTVPNGIVSLKIIIFLSISFKVFVQANEIFSNPRFFSHPSTQKHHLLSVNTTTCCAERLWGMLLRSLLKNPLTPNTRNMQAKISQAPSFLLESTFSWCPQVALGFFLPLLLMFLGIIRVQTWKRRSLWQTCTPWKKKALRHAVYRLFAQC